MPTVWGLVEIATLARLHNTDHDAIGLGDLGKREDYVARQMARWYRQYQASGGTHAQVTFSDEQTLDVPQVVPCPCDNPPLVVSTMLVE